MMSLVFSIASCRTIGPRHACVAQGASPCRDKRSRANIEQYGVMAITTWILDAVMQVKVTILSPEPSLQYQQYSCIWV
jgi:hypothetical protein